jgi:hypothetical protein
MKRIFIAGAFFLFAAMVHAQNVGIGVPVPQQKLDVDGAIKIATTPDNIPTLLNAGFTLAGEMAGITSYNTTAGLLSAFTWWPAYINGVAENIPPPPPPAFTTNSTVAVSTGTLMYVVTSTKLYSYNPVTDIWNIVSNQGFPEGQYVKGIWTGSELIFWNGVSGVGTLGSRYNPATNTWTSLPTLNSPSQRQNYSMIWDGPRMIV